MSQGSDALTPPAGVSAEEFNRLLDQGRARRALSVDDVMAVLEHVELTEDLIDGLRRRLSGEGIHLDEGEIDLNGSDLLVPEEPPPAPPVPPAVPAVQPAAPSPRPPRRSPEVDDSGGGRADSGRGGSADPVRTYLKEIGKVSLLSGAQEVALAKRIEAGLRAVGQIAELEDRYGAGVPIPDHECTPLERLVADGFQAKTQLIEANLRLVVSIAKRYMGRGLQFLDLIQEGNLGLIRAVEKFDYTKGFKFSTYATWWIRQAITRGMADQSRTIRLPVHLVEQVNKLARVKRDLHQQLGREATHEELSAETGIPAEKISDLLDHSRDPVSLDMPVGAEEEAPLGDFIEDSEAADAESAVISGFLQDDLRLSLIHI